MPTEIKIIELRTIPSPDPKRLGRMDRLVIYEAGEGNRDSVLVPNEDLTDETVTAAIAKQLQERGAWIGKKLQVGE